MKVNIHEIPRSGLFLEEERLAAELDLERNDFKFSLPVTIKANVTRELDSAHIQMDIFSQISFSCGRCLKRVDRGIKKKIDLIKPSKEGSVIDLTQIAREEIILDYPVKLICRPDCRGLCPYCGRDLNKTSCNCRPEKNPASGGLPL